MRKRLKVFTSILMGLVFVAVPVFQVAAASKMENSSGSNFTEIVQEVLDLEGYDATAFELKSKESKDVWYKVNTKLESAGFNSKLQENGYKEIKSVKVAPVKVIDDMDNSLDAYYFIKYYKNKSGEKMSALFVYNVATDSLLKVEADIISDEGDLESFYSYSEYNRPITTRGFSVWGANFACGMSGIIACGVYCGAIGIAFPIAGLICGGICNTAFAAACA